MRDRGGCGRGRTTNSWATVLHSSASGVLALALALAGCRASTPAATPPGAAPNGSEVAGPPSPSATGAVQATSSPAPTAAPKRQESIAIGNDERVVDLYEPILVDGTRPLLILLHANGESPYLMEAQSGIGVLAAREGLFVALPPAREHRWDARLSTGDPIEQSPDVTYVVGLIDRLVADLPIDRDRVFIAGFSMGGALSERLGCEAASKLTAVVLDAGAPWSDECSPARPVSILVLHGTADGTFPIALAGEVVARWRTLDRCRGAPVATQLSETVTSERNDDCAAGAAVQFVRYAGAGHRWFANPGATDLLWAFIESLGGS
jgi:polyhydroxybutyrate depolymerase